MKEINIARSILNKRKEKGMTQDDLAEYIGVSKASVSKWETGQSYPDITFLPQLATFFNISIDELMGYEPQMTKEDIRKLYHQLSMDFSSLPFDEVVSHCREIVKKYFSCFPLIFQIGALLLNHSMLAGSPEKTTEIIKEAKELFVKVKVESDDVELIKQALNMEALCALSLGNPNEVLELLEGIKMPLTSSETLLASAYEMTGKPKEARQVLQVGIYQYIVGLFGLLSSYMALCVDDSTLFEETYQRTIAVAEAFHIEKLNPSVLMSLYISASQIYLTFGNTNNTLNILEKYAELVTGDIYPLHLHGDDFFYLLDEWLEEELVLGTALPRSESIVRESMIKAVVSNPAYDSLADDLRFKRIVKRLKE